MVASLPVKSAVPPYWEEACKHLAKKDRVMRRLIPQFGDACLESRGDAFVTLARSIVGQQISVKAAQAVWDRFSVLPKKITPAYVLKLKVDDMRAAGLSARKIERSMIQKRTPTSAGGIREISASSNRSPVVIAPTSPMGTG